MKKSISADR